ncbi:MAG TPA: polysaccharide biosynthesis C-terminal domain-containing protein [Candidatus Eisenbacteria bacterium]|nr:polysaccharide biosynthesis C-terminal domain-containing protein [Candidatus Eisenbacteria bacterium]
MHRAIDVTFAGRVAGVLGTRLVQLACTLAVSFLLARLLGPDGRGVYTLLVLVPTTLFALGQLGLTSAMVFNAGRGGRLADLERHTLTLGLGVSVVVVAAALTVLPALEPTALRLAPPDLLRIALLALPLRLVATLAGSVLYGRHMFRAYNLILAVQSVLSVVLVVVLVGLLGSGVDGALAAYLLFLAFGTVAVVLYLDGVRRAEDRVAAATGPSAEADVPVSAREIAGYGLRLYPATVGTFFGYRADVFLLAWLLGSASDIGVYAVAVSLAELVFNVPDAVSTVLFPRIAAASRTEADRLAPAMARMTILVTAAAAVAVVPAAWIALSVLLPAFLPGMAALIVILPGIVALSVAKVLTSYLSGIERLAPVTTAAVASLGVNLGANLVLIPAFGIVGAAAASLVSYTAYAVLMIKFASDASSCSWRDFLVPQTGDVRRLASSIVRLRP